MQHCRKINQKNSVCYFKLLQNFKVFFFVVSRTVLDFASQSVQEAYVDDPTLASFNATEVFKVTYFNIPYFPYIIAEIRANVSFWKIRPSYFLFLFEVIFYVCIVLR